MRVSEREKQVLAFFMSYEEDNGEPPCLYEVADFLGLSRQRIHQLVTRLERKGLMAKTRGNKRCWRAKL